MSTEANSNSQQTVQLPFTTSHAFIIGINAYEHLTPLSTAVNDANELARRLSQQHGFQVHPPLLDGNHKAITKLLTKDIPNLVGEDDRVLFYFAGHGIALDGEGGPNGYLVAADTRPGEEDTLVPMKLLHDSLTDLPCRHGLLILDCCFSGAFKWSSGFRDVLFDLPKVIYEERFWRYCKDQAWQVITSAAHDQKAVDIITNQSLGLREEGSGKHSPFAASLFEALDGAGDVIPAGHGDGVMTATEIYTYLRDTVESTTTENAKRQSPSMVSLQRHDKGEFIFLHPSHRFNLPPTPDRNPFMGLSSYNEDDTSLFFGRDRVVEALLEKIETQQLTVVSGASGTGKSSVIKAGVLPRLRNAGRTILPIIRPGKEPLQTLATELPDFDEQASTGQPVLVIDQYEELITQCLHPEERVAFERKIAQWLKKYPEVDIILSVRADFEPQFESETLKSWWPEGRFVVPSFSLDEVREVITRPAAQVVLFYEPEDLVDQISEEVSQAPGALPLLSFTLSELYHSYLKSGREDRALTEADYQKLGGVIGALRTRADAEYDSLSEVEQASMRKLMLRMVSLEGGELAGKRVYSEDLHFTDIGESMRIRDIANRLVEARLLLKGKDLQGRTYIEPAHDALVRAWRRLYEWIKELGEDKIHLQAKLTLAVTDYNQLLATAPKKAANLLWNNNPNLNLLEPRLTDKSHTLNALEETFVTTSVLRRKKLKRRNWSIAAAVVLGLGALSIFGVLQMKQAAANDLDATIQKMTIDARRLTNEDPIRALRVIELGYNTAKAHELNTQQFTEMLINLVYKGTRFQLHPNQNYTQDKLKQARGLRNNTLRVSGSYIYEYTSNGNLINSYYPVTPDDPDALSGPLPELLDKAYYSPEGRYIIAEEDPEAIDENVSGSPNLYIYSRDGSLLLRAYGEDDRNDMGFFGFPFFFDQNGYVYRYSTGKVQKYTRIYRMMDLDGQLRRFEVLAPHDDLVLFANLDLGNESHPSAFSLSPSGDFIAVGTSTGMVKVYSFDKNKEILSLPSNASGRITELAFFDNETILGVNGSRYYPMEQSLTYNRNSYSHPDEPEVNPINQESISFSGIQPSHITYTAEVVGLVNASKEVLIASDDSFEARHMVYTSISDDGRYFYWNEDMYAIDPDLIFSLINDYGVLGELATVDISAYTESLPEDLRATILPMLSQSPSTRSRPRTNRAQAAPTQETAPAPEAPLTIYGKLTGDNVRMRQSPVDGAEITQVRINQRVQVLGKTVPQSDGHVWYQIVYNGQEGWMRSDFVLIE